MPQVLEYARRKYVHRLQLTVFQQNTSDYRNVVPKDLFGILTSVGLSLEKLESWMFSRQAQKALEAQNEN